MKFDIDEFEKGNIVVSCKTKRSAIDFFNMLAENGYKWERKEDNENKESEGFFWLYEKEICYKCVRAKLVSFGQMKKFNEQNVKVFVWRKGISKLKTGSERSKYGI